LSPCVVRHGKRILRQQQPSGDWQTGVVYHAPYNTDGLAGAGMPNWVLVQNATTGQLQAMSPHI